MTESMNYLWIWKKACNIHYITTFNNMKIYLVMSAVEHWLNINIASLNIGFENNLMLFQIGSRLPYKNVIMKSNVSWNKIHIYALILKLNVRDMVKQIRSWFLDNLYNTDFCFLIYSGPSKNMDVGVPESIHGDMPGQLPSNHVTDWCLCALCQQKSKGKLQCPAHAK